MPNKGGISLYPSIFNSFLHPHALILRHIHISQKLAVNQLDICLDLVGELPNVILVVMILAGHAASLPNSSVNKPAACSTFHLPNRDGCHELRSPIIMKTGRAKLLLSYYAVRRESHSPAPNSIFSEQIHQLAYLLTFLLHGGIIY